jgi:hypothetical protein
MTRLWGTALALALFAAAMWFAWLGWDHQYYKVNGVNHGPYREWQVVGCGLAIAVASVGAYLRVPRTAAILLLASAADVGFAVPWAMNASRDDATGLWGVGLIFLLIGSGAGLTVLLTVTGALANRGASRAGAFTVCCVLTVWTFLFVPMVAIVPLVGAALVFFVRWLPNLRRASSGPSA